MRLIVTGSSGQIGTNLALRCLARGDRVTGIDRRANGWTHAFPTLCEDLAAPGAAAHLVSAHGAALSGADVLVHLAAHAKVHELVREPARALENIAMTQHALELARTLRVPFVLASSREVYGDVPHLPVREDDAQVARVASPYAASKLAAEGMVHAYAGSYGVRYLVFRLSNVYGRYDDDLERMERVVPLFVRRIGEGRPVTVYGVDKRLDFTHVDDCVDGVLRGVDALCADRVRDETFNLAAGHGHSLVELAERIGEVVGRRPGVIAAPARAGEIRRYVADLGKARAMLGYAPRLQLAEGVRAAIEWQRARSGDAQPRRRYIPS